MARHQHVGSVVSVFIIRTFDLSVHWFVLNGGKDGALSRMSFDTWQPSQSMYVFFFALSIVFGQL